MSWASVNTALYHEKALQLLCAKAGASFLPTWNTAIPGTLRGMGDQVLENCRAFIPECPFLRLLADCALLFRSSEMLQILQSPKEMSLRQNENCCCLSWFWVPSWTRSRAKGCGRQWPLYTRKAVAVSWTPKSQCGPQDLVMGVPTVLCQ